MRLTGVVDGRCHVSIAKAHAWWRWAVRWAAASNRLSTGVAHIARVDDDTFLHLPNLEADMGRLHCHPRLVYGLIACQQRTGGSNTNTAPLALYPRQVAMLCLWNVPMSCRSMRIACRVARIFAISSPQNANTCVVASFEMSSTGCFESPFVARGRLQPSHVRQMRLLLAWQRRLV